jgi:hypothetical protein
MSRSTWMLLLGAVVVGGGVFWWSRRASAATAPGAPVNVAKALLDKQVAALPRVSAERMPAIIAAGGSVSANGVGVHIPTALRTPQEQAVAIAVETFANTGAGHF